jgi:integrase
MRWFGIDLKRYSKSFRLRKEAERFAETKQQEVRQGKGDPPKWMTLDAFYLEHEKLMQGKVRHNTLRMQMATLGNFAACVGWDADIKHIRMRDIEKFSAVRAATGIETITVNKEVKTLKRLFNLAIGRGYLAEGSNPCAKVPLGRVGRRRKPYCSPEHFELLFAKAEELLWQTLLVVLYVTGLRKLEAMHLLWSDIDFESGMLHISRRDAKGYVQKWSPKDHELRSIPLPKQAVNLLAAWQAVAPLDCPYVFLDAGRWAYYRERFDAGTWKARQELANNWLRRFKTLCKHTGIGKFTLHDLRRSCITNWARQLPIHVTQQLAGHSDIHTTQTYYLSVQLEDVAKAKRVQGKVISGIGDAKLTDPKLTHWTQKRDFPARKQFAGVPKPLNRKEL